MQPNQTYARTGFIEKAYVRGLKEGMARSRRKLDEKRAAYNELVIRYKVAKGQIRRLEKGIK